MTYRLIACWLLVCLISASGARGADQPVPLPYTQPDKDGNQWMVHYYGYLQQQGNMPVYASAAVLTINGNSTSGRMQRQGKLDGKTGELILENLPVNNLTVTRRFSFNKDEGYVRMIDIIHNPQNRDQQVQIGLNSNSNYGLQSGQSIPDVKKKNQTIAWVGQTGNNNRAIVEMFNGTNAKTAFNVEYQAGNAQVTANLSATIPAGKDIALMHFHATAASAAEGTDFVKKFKESKAMKDIPPALRKMILNFNSSSTFFGDYEVLRGEQNDVVEMRTGDQFRGTLKETAYKVTTFYGAVTVPVEKVQGLVTIGAVRPRQLLFTSDGDVFGGALDKEKISLELADGQVMEIPLSQVGRVGYRKRPNELEDPVFDKPFALMRTGERIAIAMPTEAITVHTRFGPMVVKPDALTALIFQNEEHAVHEIRMADGTRLAGLVDSVMFSAKLAGSEQVIKFPLTSAARIQFRAETTDGSDDPVATLKLSNDEVLVGSLSGKLQLDTGFSMLNLDAAGIKTLSRMKESPTDAQVSLWDDTTFKGQLQDPVLTCMTKGGIEVQVPIALVDEYTQPFPKPSEAVVKRIKDLVANLNDDDWNARQKAQEKLVTMGAVVTPVLKEMRGAQPEEAQSRIDQILASLEKKAKP